MRAQPLGEALLEPALGQPALLVLDEQARRLLVAGQQPGGQVRSGPIPAPRAASAAPTLVVSTPPKSTTTAVGGCVTRAPLS